MIELIISRSPAGVQPPIELRRGESVTLGREASADFAFSGDSQMSTVHVTVSAFDRHLEFIDEASTNGTFLNGSRAMSGRAADGDEIRIGQTVLIVRVHQEAEHTPARFVEPSESGADRFEPRAQKPFDQPSEEALEIEADDGSIRRLEPGGTLSIGRTPRADWVFEHDQLMSSLHCILTESHGTWEVVDSHSSNGTFLNDRRIEKAVVDDGDEVTAGNSRFRLTKCRRTPNAQICLNDDDFSDNPVEEFARRGAGEAAFQAPLAHRHQAEPSQPLIARRPPTAAAMHFDVLWMSPQDSDVAPICIARGGALTIDSASIGRQSESGAGEPTPLVALQWRAHWGEFNALPKSSDVRRNGTATQASVLVESDTLEIGEVLYKVSYKSVALSSPESAAADDLVAAAPSSAPLEQHVFAELSPREDEVPAIDDAPASVLVEPAEPASETSASGKDVANDEPAQAIDLDSIPRLADRLEGCLPGNDLIGALCRLAPHSAAWLLEIDCVVGQCVSLPFRITIDDAAWMLAVQASWPKNNYLIVFSDESADQIFEAISTFQATQADSKFTSENLAIGWGAPASASSLLTCMQGLMLIEGAASRWRFFGALDRLSEVSKELQSWK